MFWLKLVNNEITTCITHCSAVLGEMLEGVLGHSMSLLRMQEDLFHFPPLYELLAEINNSQISPFSSTLLQM